MMMLFRRMVWIVWMGWWWQDCGGDVGGCGDDIGVIGTTTTTTATTATTATTLKECIYYSKSTMFIKFSFKMVTTTTFITTNTEWVRNHRHGAGRRMRKKEKLNGRPSRTGTISKTLTFCHM